MNKLLQFLGYNSTKCKNHSQFDALEGDRSMHNITATVTLLTKADGEGRNEKLLNLSFKFSILYN